MLVRMPVVTTNMRIIARLFYKLLLIIALAFAANWLALDVLALEIDRRIVPIAMLALGAAVTGQALRTLYGRARKRSDNGEKA